MKKSQKPYLVRAIFEWCNDNQYTPYLATQVDKNTIVPLEYVENNQIVLNIAPEAINELQMNNDWITFKAMFNGIPYDIAIPIYNVIAIFAKENGQGMQFQVEIQESQNLASIPTKKEDPKPTISGLKLIK